jgi:hypothetical protein
VFSAGQAPFGNNTTNYKEIAEGKIKSSAVLDELRRLEVI